MSYRRQWLQPLKVLEYFVYGSPGVTCPQDADHQLYWAVIEGTVRARHKGKELGAEQLDQLRTHRWSDAQEELYSLPYDIELSVKDAERIWRSGEDIDPADRIAIHGMSPATIRHSAETALLNLEVLLRRLDARLPTADGSAREFEGEFESRWARHHHEARIYLAHFAEEAGRGQMLAELSALEVRQKNLMALLALEPSGSGPSDAKPSESRRYSEAALREWYEQRVKKHAKDERPPSREEDLAAARHEVSEGVPREAVRKLRAKSAPAEWKNRGRRKTGGK